MNRNSGKFVFSHIVKFMPKYEFDQCVLREVWGVGVKKILGRQDFVAQSITPSTCSYKL